jgi:hypothetical protein
MKVFDGFFSFLLLMISCPRAVRFLLVAALQGMCSYFSPKACTHPGWNTSRLFRQTGLSCSVTACWIQPMCSSILPLRSQIKE